MTIIKELERRFSEDLSDRDQGIELADFTDTAAEREWDRRPELKSRRKKLIFFQDKFGWNEMQVAHALGVSQTEAHKFLSRRGIQNQEFQAIRDRFMEVFATLSIVENHVEEYELRKRVLTKPNDLLKGLGAYDFIMAGETKRALAVAERTFNHVHGNS